MTAEALNQDPQDLVDMSILRMADRAGGNLILMFGETEIAQRLESKGYAEFHKGAWLLIVTDAGRKALQDKE